MGYLSNKMELKAEKLLNVKETCEYLGMGEITKSEFWGKLVVKL